ncbi:MAG: hypothetical protein AAFZ58_06235 [Pseudomonadota bacterium]
MSRLQYIDSTQNLSTACAAIAACQQLGVDTEFVRERTFFARLCLIQIATHDEIFLIDPLAFDDLELLWQALDQNTLILHAARQDLEIIGQTAKRLPTTVRDTQIMAALAGFAPQIGYAALVRELIGVELDKSKTRTDWSRRPLDASERAYAGADVAHLDALHGQLAEKLSAMGRLEWAQDDSQALLAPALYDNPAELAWQRVKGLSRLPPAQRSTAMALAAWRESVAVDRNLPRQWVLRDSELLAIAAQYRFNGEPPRGFEDRNTERRHAGAIQRYLDAQRDRLPEAVAGRGRPDPAERERTDRTAALVAAVAADLGVEAEVIASMREIRAVSAGKRDARLFQGWRRSLVGESVLAELDRSS